MKNVLHVSHLKAHLISPQRLVNDISCRFIFDDDGCYLFDKVMGQRTEHVREDGRLLYLDEELTTCSSTQGQIHGDVEKKKMDQALLYHYQFRDLSFELLKTWFPYVFNVMDIKTIFYKTCQLAKHKHSVFGNMGGV